MRSRTVSSSKTIPLLKTVFLSAQHSDTPPRVWNMVTSPRHLGCGDVADITNNGGKIAAESDCTTACSGDPVHLCAGSWRLQLYLWNSNLNT
ncbi:hypothetical protein EDB84DRAFT_1580983 [Lactarius hengduanensis]|nr:hypothetical protein EDB84DRAFT_1580983 [Lactarius hengduanensis]